MVAEPRAQRLSLGGKKKEALARLRGPPGVPRRGYEACAVALSSRDTRPGKPTRDTGSRRRSGGSVRPTLRPVY